MTATKIAYIQAAWHANITDRCKEAFTQEIQRKGYQSTDLDFFSIPGSLEVPLFSKKLAQTGRYLAICASGLEVSIPKILGTAITFTVAYGLALKFAFPVGQRWLENRARRAADREATRRRIKGLFRSGGGSL
jgi:hypothetical protein